MERLFEYMEVFRLKNVFVKFQKVIDHVFTCLDFSKCYIDEIIVFNSTMEEHGHQLQDVFKFLEVHAWVEMKPMKV
jgi:hypothetical protein